MPRNNTTDAGAQSAAQDGDQVSPPGRPHARLIASSVGPRKVESLFGLIEPLSAAIGDLRAGRTTDALTEIEGVLAALQQVVSEEVEEAVQLSRLPALHLIDAELHKHRRPVLDRYAPRGEWRQNGSYRREADDLLAFRLHVAPNDVWAFKVDDGPRGAGRGLLSLLAFITGEMPSATAARLAPKMGLAPNG